MKSPLAILIAIMVFILGFLVVYSQQHDMTTAKVMQGEGSAAGYGSGSAPASGGYGTAPAAGGYGSAPAPAAGGYGAPAAGGYGK
jgi:hypothetical protein